MGEVFEVAVEAVELVVSALAVGAVAGVMDPASVAEKDAHASVQNGARARASKYDLRVRDSRGVQIGDRNTMNLKF